MTYYSDWRIDIPLWIICPTCGRIQSSRNNYCSNCGRKFVNNDFDHHAKGKEIVQKAIARVEGKESEDEDE